ncbi:hypothetical protein PBRA_003390 [Plasmodiophora brassicae]|nr:hypothetical protein PBRA_003390 [Plasmodiophora brassicae]
MSTSSAVWFTPTQSAWSEHRPSKTHDSSPSRGMSQYAHNSSLYKTELCRSFSDHGYCRYSNKCQFAHGLADLRPVVRHRRWKTEKCKNYLNGNCPYGSRCDFIHQDDFIYTPDAVPGYVTPIPPPSTARPLSAVGAASFTPPIKQDSMRFKVPVRAVSPVNIARPSTPVVVKVPAAAKPAAKPSPVKEGDKRLPFFKHLVDDKSAGAPHAQREDPELIALMAQL